MKRLASLMIGLSMLLGAAAALADGHLDVTEADHPAGQACESCHAVDPRMNLAKVRLVRRQEKTCVECHPSSISEGHPSGFRPTRKLPAQFPLHPLGEFTCSSCHTVHFKPPVSAKASPYLRVPESGRAFCIQCHDEMK